MRDVSLTTSCAPIILPYIALIPMNSVKTIRSNFRHINENNKMILLLCGDSRFDENKNKVTLQL